MGRIAEVLDTERTSDEDGEGLDVQCDPGGAANVTAPHFADPGDDSPPLPGDSVALEASAGAGTMQAVGYADTRNAGKAAPGEKRIYARNPQGQPVTEIWCKGDGTIEITSLVGGNVVINGVTIDAQGNVVARNIEATESIEVGGDIEAAGDIDAGGNIAAEGNVSGTEVSNASISLGTHVHSVPALGTSGPGASPPPDP